MFRDLGLPTTDGPPLTGSPGASTSMPPPSLPAARRAVPLTETTPLYGSYTPRSVPAFSRTVPSLGRPPVVTPSTPASTPRNISTPGGMNNVVRKIQQRLEVEYPGQVVPIAKILQSMLPEGYNITATIPGLPATPLGFEHADTPPPRPEFPAPRATAETEADYQARMDRHYRFHAMYLQEYQGYELRMKTRQHVRSLAKSSEKNIRKIADCVTQCT